MKRRTFHTPGQVSIRAAEGGTAGDYLVGYAAVFEVESAVMFDEDVTDEDGEPIPFNEVLDPNVFDRTLRENPDVRALYNHDTSSPLGRVKPGTLVLTLDDHGLSFRDLIPDTQAGRDARVLVGRGDVDGCSFGFYVVKDQVVLREGKPALRRLLDVDLFEVSIAVTFPAYTETETALRARHAARRTEQPPRRPRLDHALRRLRVLRLSA